MPGLRENALIPDDAGYVFPTGKYFNDLKALFEMMFRNLAAVSYTHLVCTSTSMRCPERVVSIMICGLSQSPCVFLL